MSFQDNIKLLQRITRLEKELERLKAQEIGNISQLAMNGGTSSSEIYTINGGVIDIDHSVIGVISQTDPANDDLDTINGTKDGQIVVVKLNGLGGQVTLKDDTGNLRLNGDFTLTSVRDRIMLINDGFGNLCEISRSDNA